MRRKPQGMPDNFGPAKAFRESFHFYTIAGDVSGDPVKVEYVNRKWNCLKCNSDSCAHVRLAKANFEAGAQAAGSATSRKLVWEPEAKTVPTGKAEPKSEKAKA